MGLDLTPGNSKENLFASKQNIVKVVKEFEPEPDAFTNDNNNNHMLRVMYERLGMREIEKKIGYTFKEKSFLLQAFTHSSYGENFYTDSYERLEYLGDAVLDFLVSLYIYTNSDADPGRLTDIRSALVCNNMFASLLVDKGLHGNILYSAPFVRAKIYEYIEGREREEYDLCKPPSNQMFDDLSMINETEPPELEEVEVPKTLGDVFEALMGAVFIDSGHSLEKVWEVYNRFEPRLESIVKDPPRNPKKILHELFTEVSFGKAVVKEKGVKVTVKLNHHNKEHRFTGLGNNKKTAQVAAAKCALRKLARHPNYL